MPPLNLSVPGIGRFVVLTGPVCPQLVAYAQLLPIAGFVLATTVATAFLCWRLGANARQSAQAGVLTAVGIFVLFQYALGVNMAKGPWGF